jgi:hypothetical protein
LCLHHEKEAGEALRSKETGGHANLYTACFGLASLALIEADMEPRAHDWLQAVLMKYRKVLLRRDGAADGTYQPDGNWSIEYAYRYKFIFLDAYRLAAGEDLVRDYRDDLLRPIHYLKYAYMGDGNVPVKRTYDPNETMLDTYQINAFGSLYLRYASLTGDPYLQWIGMSNPAAGGTHAYRYKVKGGHRFLYSTGYTDYLWYDPRVRPAFSPPEKTAVVFPQGELAAVRSGFGAGLTVAYQGRRGNIMYENPNLIVNLNGKSMFCSVPAAESLPLAEANGPAAGGGEMERVGVIRHYEELGDSHVLRISGFRTDQRITIAKGNDPVIDIAVKRRKRSARQVSLRREDDRGFVRLRGEGYLQYAAAGNFDPDRGMLQIEFRLSKRPAGRGDRPAVLFSIGQHLRYSFGNAVYIGFLEEGRLGVLFKDNEGRRLTAQFAEEPPVIGTDQWQTVTVYWRNLNSPGASPTCGIMAGGRHAEAHLAMPPGKAFVCRPNTSIWVGGGVQMPNSFAHADVSWIKICGGDANELLFHADYRMGMDAVYAKGSGHETAESGLEYRLHAQDGDEKRVIVHPGYVQVVNQGESVYLVPMDGEEILTETLPRLQAGFAGECFEDEEEEAVHKRIVVKPKRDPSRLHFQIRRKPPDHPT